MSNKIKKSAPPKDQVGEKTQTYNFDNGLGGSSAILLLCKGLTRFEIEQE